MEEIKISDFDPEFLLSQLKQESLNADYWYQKCKKLEHEIHLIQRILNGVMMEANQ